MDRRHDPHSAAARKGGTADRLRTITERLAARTGLEPDDADDAPAPPIHAPPIAAPPIAPSRNTGRDMPQAAIAGQTKYCPGCGLTLHASARACPQCGATQPGGFGRPVAPGAKSRVAAIVLALLLGGIGIHKFYLGRTGAGILYLLFCWTGVPAVLGLIEAILYATMDDERFAAKYG